MKRSITKTRFNPTSSSQLFQKQCLLALALLVVCSTNTQAQLDSAEIDSLARRNVQRYDPAGFVRFIPNTVTPGEPIELYFHYFTDDTKNSMVLQRRWEDPLLGMTHYRYQQFNQGIPVEYAIYTEHARNGYVTFANGRVSDLDSEISPDQAMPSSEALQQLWVAKGFEGSGEYLWPWEAEGWDKELQTESGDPAATYYPTYSSKLMWAVIEERHMPFIVPGINYRLAWVFDVKCLDPDFHTAYYVDAITGVVFKELPLDDYNGPANIADHGSQTIDTKYYGGLTNSYILETDDGYPRIHTKYQPTINLAWSFIGNITDDDDDWGDHHQGATAPHWFATQTWEYFRTVHERNGVDGNGTTVRILEGWNQEGARFTISGFSTPMLQFGEFDGGKTARAIDIVAHEFTHGITHYTAELGATYEQGALNESFSDIFGVLAERHIEGNLSGYTPDWTIGEDEPNVGIRSLIAPKNAGEHFVNDNGSCSSVTGQPDTYEGEFWQFNSCDQGGIHVNSGVQNHWFYLLAEGGSGTNDNQDNYSVTGIGITDAAEIAFWSLTNILESGDEYEEARAASVEAVIEINNGVECTFEQIQVENAWFAVGVGEPSPCAVMGVGPIEGKADQPYIYPNPVSDLLHINFLSAVERKIIVTDIQGRSIISKTFFSNSNVLDVSHLNAGVYFLTVNDGHASFSHKIVKQ